MTTHLEFEGQISEQRFVMEGEEPPTWGPDADLSVVGKPIPRVDGRERVTGAAKFTYDIQLPGMLYATALRSPHPHARVTAIDSSRAEAMPGVRAVFSHLNAGELKDPNRGIAIFRPEVLYQGEEVALVVAETLEQAEEAAAQLRVTYAPLPFVANDLVAEKPDAPQVSADAQSNVLDTFPKTYERGNVEAGLAEADATIAVTVETPCAVHNSMETHGTVATWDGRTLVAYISTQDIYGSRRAIANALGLQQNQVNVICQYMGGGFGAKFGPHRSGLIAAYATHRLGKPIHFMLSREAENLAAGNRAPTTQYYRAGAKKDGTLTALELRGVANVGAMGNWYAPVALPAKELYQCPNVRTIDVPVRTNLGSQASFRAPGVVEGTVGLELALDQLAYEIGMDPLEFRRKNYAENNQLMGGRPYAASRCCARMTSAPSISAGRTATASSGATPTDATARFAAASGWRARSGAATAALPPRRSRSSCRTARR